MVKSNSDKPTLEVVRAVAEKMARDTARSVREVTVPELHKDLSGSDGYLGAHLQTVKIECARAERFDTNRLPALLVSGLCEVLEMFQKRGEETGRAEGKITQELYEQICQSNDVLVAKVATLEQQLEKMELEHKVEKHDHDTKMQDAQVEILTLTNNYNSTQHSLAETTRQLGDAKHELGVQTGQAKGLEGLVSAKDQMITDLNQRLSEAENKLETAETEASQQKQIAGLLNMRNNDLSTELSNLKNELQTAYQRAADAEAELRVRAVKSAAPSKKKPSSSDNK